MKVVETEKVPGHAQYLILWCPGCKCLHPLYHKREDHKGPVWNWNGSFDKPTFTPSLLMSYTTMTEKGQKEYEEWAASGYPDRQGRSFESRSVVCHSFITDGKIQFLSDCTHHLRGQTVELPDDPLTQKA